MVENTNAADTNLAAAIVVTEAVMVTYKPDQREWVVPLYFRDHLGREFRTQLSLRAALRLAANLIDQCTAAAEKCHDER